MVERLLGQGQPWERHRKATTHRTKATKTPTWSWSSLLSATCNLALVGSPIDARAPLVAACCLLLAACYLLLVALGLAIAMLGYDTVMALPRPFLHRQWIYQTNDGGKGMLDTSHKIWSDRSDLIPLRISCRTFLMSSSPLVRHEVLSGHSRSSTCTPPPGASCRCR